MVRGALKIGTQPVFPVLRWRKVGQQFVDGEPLGPGQPNFVIQGGGGVGIAYTHELR